MSLDIQINTLLASFLYGIFFSRMLNINYKFVYESKKIYRIIISFLFIMVNVLIYFIILMRVNNGILHNYGILSIILGVLFDHFIVTKLLKMFTKQIKKCYNHSRIG